MICFKGCGSVGVFCASLRVRGSGFRAYGPQVRICQDRGSVWFKAGVLTFGFQDLRLEFRLRFLWLQQGIGWVEG